MTDYRQTKSDRFKKPLDERGNPHGGRGRRAARDIAEQFETQTGHPLGSRHAGASRGRHENDKTARGDLSRGQHARKGQAESPRERSLNQPEKKKKKGGR
jgi:hypothetical protein